MVKDTYSRTEAEEILLETTGIVNPCLRLIKKFFKSTESGSLDSEKNKSYRYIPKFTRFRMIEIATKSDIKKFTEDFYKETSNFTRKKISIKAYKALDTVIFNQKPKKEKEPSISDTI